MNTTVQGEYEAIRAWWTAAPRELARAPRDESSLTNRCFYRGSQEAASPLRCAFGCRIPDELYEPEMDMGNSTLRNILAKHVSLRNHFGISLNAVRELDNYTDGDEGYLLPEALEDIGDNKEMRVLAFWLDAQQIHDEEAVDAPDFVRRLDVLAAQEFGLTVFPGSDDKPGIPG